MTTSASETEAAAAELASSLRAGDVVLLEGEMGSGKTTFVRGAARALGYHGPVTSPTFALANRYEGGRTPIAHLDLHRLRQLGAEDEGLIDDSLSGDVITLIEWPQVAEQRMVREPRARVVLEHAGGDRRKIEIVIGG